MQIDHTLVLNKPRKKALRGKENLLGYLFISPWLAGFFILTVIPVIVSFGLSFTRYDILSAPKFIGLANFQHMLFEDERFWKAVKATFYFAFASVPLRLSFALFVAMLLYKGTRASGFYRTVYYMPSIIGGSVAVAIMWRQIFGAEGAVNGILSLVGINVKISWLTHEGTAMWTIIALAVWQFGSAMLIFLAGLKQIPYSLYESAIIDGVNPIQKFTKITLPMLTPVIFFNLIMQIISGFKAFTESYIITQGKPFDSTLLYAKYLYDKSFVFFEMGYGCAMAWFLLLIIAICSAAVFKSSSYWVYYESKGDM